MVLKQRLNWKDTSRRTTALLAVGFLLNVGIMTKAIADAGGANQYEYCFLRYCNGTGDWLTRVSNCVEDGCEQIHPGNPHPQAYYDCLANALRRMIAKPVLACPEV
jgi:hypothetical protein